MQFLKRHLSFVALIFSWLFLFHMLRMTTDWGLAPWGSIFPLPDSLTPVELALNSFFDVGLGQYLFALPALLITIWVWWRMRRRRHNLTLTLSLVLSNFILAYAFGIGLYIAGIGNRLLFPQTYGVTYVETLGYHVAILPLLSFVLTFSLWVRFHQRLLHDGRGEKIKRNNNSCQEAVHLLTDSEKDKTELNREIVLKHGLLQKWEQHQHYPITKQR